MLDITYGGAFLAGLLSFISPCVLPIVPPYMAYLAGLTIEEMADHGRGARATRQLVLSAGAFVLGFSTVFIALGMTASIVGQFIGRYFDVLSIIAGVIIVIMGLHFLGLFRIGLLYRDVRFQANAKPVSLIGVYVLGLAFAFGWTPCVGPVLAAILFVAGGEGTAGHGASLLAIYSLGIGLPFLLAAILASRFLPWAANFRRHLHKVELVTGGVLVLTGILFMTGQMSEIANWLLTSFPAFERIG
ncbi:MAG: cytochrome c biogenesis protein CcdA [Dongiaceae bacterium]